MTEPALLKIKTGWLALGEGWAVEGPTKDDALKAFEAAQLRHEEIDGRPLPGPSEGNQVA